MARNPALLVANYGDRSIKVSSLRLSDARPTNTTDYAEIITGTGAPSGGYGRDSSASLIYIRQDPASVNTLVYLSPDGGSNWTAMSSASVGAIADTGTYYTTDTIDGAFDALGAQIGGDTDATFNFTNGTGSLLTDDDAVYAALDKLDQGFVSLKSTANAKGASLVGIEDAAGLLAAGTVEAALLELVKYVPVNLADPGTGAAIPVTRSAHVAITTAGAETNTLAIPTFIGQKLILVCDVYVGDRVVTAAAPVNQTGNNTLTFGAAGDFIVLEAAQIAGALVWRVVANDGVALSTV